MEEVRPRHDTNAHNGSAQSNRYDEAVEDFWRDLDSDDPAHLKTAVNTIQESIKDIDQEIKITKKRKPVAKLDADRPRLLSERGVPELRRRANKRIKLRGKGNEFEDIGNLLQMYQMWLDDLYPKAKFRDGLAMVEKLGHTKRLNVMRRAWITATRPMQTREEVEDAEIREEEPMAEADRALESAESLENTITDQTGQQSSDISQPRDAQASNGVDHLNESPGGHPDEDELDALLAEHDEVVPTNIGARLLFEDDSDQDELDALLAEESAAQQRKPARLRDEDNDRQHDDEHRFADEEGVLNDMDQW